MDFNSPQRNVLTGAIMRTVVLASIMTVALITLMVPSAGAAESVSVGDDYSETFGSQCGSSATVKVWHPGGYDSGTGSVTVQGTFPAPGGWVTMTAISTRQDCTHAEMRYFTVHGSDQLSSQTLSTEDQCLVPNLTTTCSSQGISEYYGGRVDKPTSEQTTVNGDKIVGYTFSNDFGNAVNEDSGGGVVVREIIEDTNGRQRLGKRTCIGVVVYTTGQVMGTNTQTNALSASARNAMSGCLDEQQAAEYIANHAAAQAAFATKWPSHYVASAWSHTRQ